MDIVIERVLSGKCPICNEWIIEKKDGAFVLDKLKQAPVFNQVLIPTFICKRHPMPENAKAEPSQ